MKKIDPLVRAGTYATPERIAKARAFAADHFVVKNMGECATCGEVRDLEQDGACEECYTDAVAHGGDLPQVCDDCGAECGEGLCSTCERRRRMARE